ncbi:MAG: asparagine synthase C-terminal domain-containing protein, partial [Actinomycetia bacterium]|nr:asparagine synthase C-terminal domain-containing protein [Actinomycetes bacterium]
MTFEQGRAGVIGERLGFPEIYLYHSKDLVVAGTDSGSVLDRLAELGGTPSISPFAMSQLLHHGLVPPPYTEWDDLWFIGIGASATLSATSEGMDLSIERTYPFLAGNSKETSAPSTAKLLELLTAATDRQLKSAGNSGFLMMSSGKDSVSVAVALAEGGHTNVPCITYRPHPADEENELASEICRQLGLKHQTLDLPVDPAVVEEILVRFFEGSPRPCGDNAQIPYALAIAESGLTAGAVFDGSGSDLYMGYVPGPDSRKKQRYRIRNEAIARAVERVIPVDSSVNYLTRSRVATALPGRAFRLPDTNRFYPDVVDTRPWWLSLSEGTSGMGDDDVANAVVQIFEDQAGVHLKAHMAAQAFGMEASLPYCDPDLVEYAFDLPMSDRFDPETGVTKILVRRMLLDTIGYDAEAVGKHYFGFAGDRFLIEHRS